MTQFCEREDRLSRAARSVYCSWTPGDPSVRQLAILSGLQYHYVWRRFPDQEQARRKTVEPWIRELGLNAPSALPVGASLHDRATELARMLAAYFASERYRLMLYLVVRDARRFPWLPSGYKRNIVAPIQRTIEELVRDYGRRSNRYAALRRGAAELFFTKLETHFALCALRPPTTETVDDSLTLINSTASLLVASVDLLDVPVAA